MDTASAAMRCSSLRARVAVDDSAMPRCSSSCAVERRRSLRFSASFVCCIFNLRAVACRLRSSAASPAAVVDVAVVAVVVAVIAAVVVAVMVVTGVVVVAVAVVAVRKRRGESWHGGSGGACARSAPCCERRQRVCERSVCVARVAGRVRMLACVRMRGVCVGVCA